LEGRGRCRKGITTKLWGGGQFLESKNKGLTLGGHRGREGGGLNSLEEDPLPCCTWGDRLEGRKGGGVCMSYDGEKGATQLIYLKLDRTSTKGLGEKKKKAKTKRKKGGGKRPLCRISFEEGCRLVTNWRGENGR